MFSKFFSLLACLALAISAWAQTPKYFFYFIGDGMGMGHVMTAQTYNRTVLCNDKPLTMMQFPVSSLAMTYSANKKITDSAAAGTALSTGSKTNNGMLGMLPDETPVYSIATELKKLGYGIAIGTSVEPDDATPGAFYTHVPSRSMYYEIGMDMAKSDYDMFVGSVLRGAKDDKGKDTGLVKALKSNGYTVVEGREAFEKNKNKDKIVLLNNDSRIMHFGYTIDSIKDNLHLPYITQACLDHLKRVSPDKFFMMIEGGNIDWAAHANDGGAVVKEILNFNEAIKIAYDFYLQHPDETLIVVTADHNTGGMQMGVEDGPDEVNLKNMDYQRVSIEMFEMYCKDLIDSGKTVKWDDMKSYLTKNLGLYGPIAVNKEQDEELREKFESTFVEHDSDDVETLYTTYNEFVETVFDTLDHINGIGWTTTSHAGDFVPVFAVGVGSEKFSNVNNNIDIPAKMRKIAGITK